MNSQEIQQFNLAHHGKAFVLTSGSKSHFMTADTLSQVFDQLYSPALEIQRKRCLISYYVCIFHVSI